MWQIFGWDEWTIHEVKVYWRFSQLMFYSDFVNLRIQLLHTLRPEYLFLLRTLLLIKNCFFFIRRTISYKLKKMWVDVGDCLNSDDIEKVDWRTHSTELWPENNCFTTELLFFIIFLFALHLLDASNKKYHLYILAGRFDNAFGLGSVRDHIFFTYYNIPNQFT